jgi:hypothetical protein
VCSSLSFAANYLTVCTSAVAEVHRDLSPEAMDVVTTYPTPEDQDAEMIILRGESLFFFYVCVIYLFIF